MYRLIFSVLLSFSLFSFSNSAPGAFNGAADIGPMFEKLKQDYQITTVIETGTFQGKTTEFFGQHFREVHTIDISPTYYNQSKQALSNYSNIHFHFGSSDNVLAQILPAMKDRFILFYLDAHWNEFWPLRDEIEQISKTHRNNCIIVVDDVKVPGRTDVPFDAYGPHECSLEYVKDKIEKVFDRYTIHYLIPNNPSLRAKLLILPN
jgi:predicted O-methyltransferase YrrM